MKDFEDKQKEQKKMESLTDDFDRYVSTQQQPDFFLNEYLSDEREDLYQAYCEQNEQTMNENTGSFHFTKQEKLFVIKIGGNVIDSTASLQSFLKDFAAIEGRKILIHGGGKIATAIGEQLGIESKYVNGRRITDDATIDLVTMVYGGLVNKKMVAQLQFLGCNAIGLTGADGNIVPATKRPVKEVDFGWVGDVENGKLKVENVKLFLDNGLVPVFASLTHDGQGNILNTNADTIASALSVALSLYYDVRLIYCFEKKGVLENVNDDDSVIKLINKETHQQLLNEQKLFAGILPKIDNAFAAIDAGVKEVLIGDAKDLIQNTSGKTSGTLFVQ